MGAAGPVMIFVVLLVYTVIVSAYFLSYAAHCFLVVVQDTAAGIDEVIWPDEPVIDWLGRSVYLWSLLALWLAPAGILARVLRRTLLPGDPTLRFLILAVPGLWAYLPVGLLSALSSVSSWAPLRLVILRQLLRIAPTVLGFYLLSALLAAAAAVAWYYALVFSPILLPVAGGVGAAVVLIYARLIGRLGYLVYMMEPPAPRQPAKAEKRRPAKKGRKPKRRPSGATAHDPWAVPEDAGTEDLPLGGYQVVEKQSPEPGAAEQAKARKKYRPPSPDEIEAYGVSSDAPPAAEDQDNSPPPQSPERPAAPPDRPPVPEPSELEMRLRERAEPGPPPAWPLLNGVLTFPWYSQSLKYWLWLSVGGFAVGIGLAGMASFWPGR